MGYSGVLQRSSLAECQGYSGLPRGTRGIPSVVRPRKRRSGRAYFLRFTASHTTRVLTPTLPQSVAPFRPPSRARAHGLLCRSLARASSRSAWCVTACAAVTGVLNRGTHSHGACGGLLRCVADASSGSDPRRCVRLSVVPSLLLRVATAQLMGAQAHRIRNDGSKLSRRTRAVVAPMLQRQPHEPARSRGHAWRP
jgi:hypothetical protein